MTHELAFMDVRSLRCGLIQGEFSPHELMVCFVERIQRFNETSRAFITVSSETALKQAGSVHPNELGQSAFSGIPFASKDLFDIAGMPTTAGSNVFQDRIATRNATVIDRLLRAGAISLGKTNLHEFAYGATGENEVYGTCINAYDGSRLACGSSSGSAAAVAFGLVPMALGTDTGGSVRAPAVLNGLVGLKPTLGRVPTDGVFPYCWTLDHVGLLTRTVADCADMFCVLSGQESLCDARSQGARTLNGAHGFEFSGLRVGIPSHFFFERTDPEILAAVDRVKSYLSKLGVVLVPVTLPDLERSRTVSLTVQMPEALSAHSPYLQQRGNLYSQEFRAGLALGQYLLAEHYIKAKRMIELYRRETNAVFEDVDVILTPATPEIAPKIGTVKSIRDGVEEAVGNAITRFTTFFNMTGHPAITLPCGLHSEGLPLGVQLIGRYDDEAMILAVAHAIECDAAFSIPLPVIAN